VGTGMQLSELSAMHKSEVNEATAFMSRQQDDVRMFYEKNKSKFPRQCVIWGMTNDQQYLRDTTGGHGR
jgi:putative DNA primase/helicase